MELIAILTLGALVFAALSLARAHWFRLADCLYRLGPARLAAFGWPAAHPFSHVDPKADGQGGALGVFPVRRIRARVLVHGLPEGDLPDAARHHARRFRLWALGVVVLVTLAAAAIHPAAIALVAVGAGAAILLVPRWPAAPAGAGALR